MHFFLPKAIFSSFKHFTLLPFYDPLFLVIPPLYKEFFASLQLHPFLGNPIHLLTKVGKETMLPPPP